MSTPQENHIVMTGMMGSGKTAVGLELAEILGWPFDDSDADLERRTGSTGRDIADKHGLAVLHSMEADSLLSSLLSEIPRVITAAGSVIESIECRNALAQRAFVVFLDVDVGLMLERFSAEDHRRSTSREELVVMRERRLPLYESTAQLTLDADRPVPELVDTVLAALADGG
ncbi:MAG: shikimate kinase [Acidimicrobiales bacterium]|nr:shikimate kinase [Acidimicrobiales bacterium]